MFASLDRPPTVVMLVSSVASEGKSTSSILLALMSAQMDKSAIVVDCDLRRPSLHTLLETEPGVSHSLPDVLAGSVSLEEAIEEDPETRLHFLAGRPGQQMSANAADILSSGRFHDVVEELRSAYDLVILDAPPVLSVTDARIVGNLADAVLYCVRWDHTTRGAVLEGLREFAMVGQKITGLVLTMVDQRKASSYGYSDCGYGTYKNRAGDPYLDA
jgi:capsular exopolysaccharide synthesis family protein